MQPIDMRLLLQNELTSRCAKNPKYSLRSFAKFLAVSPAALSALINGKRPITTRMKERLGLKLGFSLEALENVKSKPHGNIRSPRATVAFQQITMDAFAIVSEPYHYSLLELLKTSDFQNNARWIAQRLGITPSEVNMAFERLQRAKLLYRDKQGNWIDSTSGFSTDIREGLTSEAQRRFQVKSLETGISAVENIPASERDNTSMTLAINLHDLPKARELIKEFRRAFAVTLEDQSSLDEVYQLTVSFVPVSVRKKTRRES